MDWFLYDTSGCSDDPNSGTGACLAFSIRDTNYEDLTWSNGTGSAVTCVLRVYVRPTSPGDCCAYDLWVTGTGPGDPTLFCSPSFPNSAGTSVTLGGSAFSGPGLVHLEATGGPNAQFGYFLVSASHMDPGIPVSHGMLCLGSPMGRYNGVSGASSVGRFDAAGVFQNLVGTASSGTGFDVPTSLPSPPAGGITSGSTFHFQLWHRDGIYSSVSDGLTVIFP